MLLTVIRNSFERQAEEFATNRDYKPIRGEWWVQELTHIVNWMDAATPTPVHLWYHLRAYHSSLRFADGPKKAVERVWRSVGYHLSMLQKEIEEEEDN